MLMTFTGNWGDGRGGEGPTNISALFTDGLSSATNRYPDLAKDRVVSRNPTAA